MTLPETTEVIQDSGAFCDGPGSRKSFDEALNRQLVHSIKYGYDNQVTHRASYDLLIDEKWQNGRRSKSRWTEEEARVAVNLTVSASKYMVQNYDNPAVLSAQGVTPRQYMECVTEILRIIRPADILGLGGWCISGKMPAIMRPVFNETMKLIIPVIGNSGIDRVHIWGVADVTFLGPLLWLCDRAGIELSTDSSGPQTRPVMGVWGYRGWYKPYPRPPQESRGIHRMLLVKLFRCRLNTLRQSEFYHHPDLPDGKLLPLEC